MPKTQTVSLDRKIITAALHAAASRGWKNTTLEHIAKAAKISVAQLKTRAVTRQDILPLIVRDTTAQLAREIGKASPNDKPRDRIFEVIMARLDLLQANRKAMLSIIQDSKCDPQSMRTVIPAEIEAVRAMVALAGIRNNSLPQPILAAGVGAIYAATLHVWRRDETLDMSKTMAKLDRLLRLADRIMSMSSSS